jgi:hypothetical protein
MQTTDWTMMPYALLSFGAADSPSCRNYFATNFHFSVFLQMISSNPNVFSDGKLSSLSGLLSKFP